MPKLTDAIAALERDARAGQVAAKSVRAVASALDGELAGAPTRELKRSAELFARLLPDVERSALAGTGRAAPLALRLCRHLKLWVARAREERRLLTKTS